MYCKQLIAHTKIVNKEDIRDLPIGPTVRLVNHPIAIHWRVEAITVRQNVTL